MHTFTAVLLSSGAAGRFGLFGLCASLATMETEFTFLIPLPWEKRAERMEFARRRGFGVEVNAFVGGDPLNDPECRARMEDEFEQDMAGFEGIKTMHGAFLDLAIHSNDQRIATISQNRIERDILTATRLGCEKIVFHLGSNPLVLVERYNDELIRAHAEFWTYVMESYPGIQVCVENQWETDWTLFSEIFDAVRHPRFGMCLDVAHVHVFSHFAPEAWIQRLAPNISHCHWNDNCGDRDSHLALGSGNIDWPAIFEASAIWKQMTVTLEISELQALERSVSFLVRHGMDLHDSRSLTNLPLSALKN